MAPRMAHIKSLKITASHLIGNKEKKKLKNMFPNDIIFKDERMYKINKTREKITFISEDGIPMLFSIDNEIFIPTLAYAQCNDMNLGPKVFLDKGALKPIMGGANVMAPGVYKYKDKIKEGFNVDDVVFIVVESDIVAVGLATMTSNEICENKKGVAIEVLHRLGDALNDIRV